MIKDLIARRVPHIMGLYLAAGWGALEFTDYIVNRYLLSPNLVDLVLLTWLLMTPTVAMLAYYHGRPGRDEWTRVEKVGIPINAVVAVVILFLTFQGQELGAATRQVTVETEAGETVKRTIPKSEFRQRLALYYFNNESGDSTVDWLRRGIPMAVELDLLQDIFIDVRTAWPHFYKRLREEGYPEGVDLPLALRREIADDLHLEYFVSGTIEKDGGQLVVAVSLHDVERGKLVQERTFRGDDMFGLVDQISVQLKRDLEIPEQQIEEGRDLPYAELATQALPALRDYVSARKAMEEEDYKAAAKRYASAVDKDPSFALANLGLFEANLVLNESSKSAQALESAMQHAYKLPERLQFAMRGAYYLLVKQDPDKARAVAGMYTELFPEDITAHRMQLQIYTNAGDWEKAIAAGKRILELDPGELDMLRTVGSIYKEMGDFERASEYFERYAGEAPTDPRGLNELGELSTLQGDHQTALDYYNRALVLEPDNVWTMLEIADVEIRLGRHDRAERSFEDAMSAASTAAQRQTVYEALRHYYQRRGQMTKALEFMYLRWEELERAEPPLQVLLSKMSSLDTYVLAGFADSARTTIASFERELEPPFDKLTAIGRLGLAEETEDAAALESALAEMEELIAALGLDIFRPLVILNHGRLSEIRGDCEGALRTYERALDLLPTSLDIHGSIGRCQRKLGQHEAAIEHLNKLLEVDPSKPRTHLEIARSLIAQGREAEARQHLESALEVWAEADPGFELAQEARAELQGLGSPI